ncbi:MAG TPA: helix-turn-helix domain-containing protein [Ramlibacter sp.]|nr:helix-turn-helix domain-containing protein [Ramlibacter sp.]
MTPIPVFFVLLPGSLVLDWGGPAEAFRIANQALAERGKPPRFELRFTGPHDSPRTSVGIAVAGVEPFPAKVPANTWLVLVGTPGNRFDAKQPGAPETLRWLRTLSPGREGLHVITVCAGALLAAHAGLLDGRRATTHHEHLDELRKVAASCEVVVNRVFVIDGCIASSAGVTTGIDLALHLIAQECGAPLAARVAQALVIGLRRGPQDPQLSPFLAHRDHMHPVLHRVQDAVCADPQREWTVARMAEVGHASPRHLTRLFVEHAATAPLLYVRRIRLALAQAALASGQGVTQAAELAGFSSDTQLRRAWHRLGLAGTPSRAASLQNR